MQHRGAIALAPYQQVGKWYPGHAGKVGNETRRHINNNLRPPRLNDDLKTVIKAMPSLIYLRGFQWDWKVDFHRGIPIGGSIAGIDTSLSTVVVQSAAIVTLLLDVDPLRTESALT